MITLKKIFWLIIFLLIILELCLSVYLIYESQTLGNLCVAGQGCDLVQSSSYAYLFGIKLMYIAIFAFLFLMTLFIFSEPLFVLASIIGAAFAFYFISLQLFVLKQICSTCVVIDSTMILIAILGIIGYFTLKKKIMNKRKIINKKKKSKKQKN